MQIADILTGKGEDVLTVRPDATVRDLVALLAEHNIGAAVVTSDGRTVEGIVSERDIVRSLTDGDTAALERAVSAIMTSEVASCTPTTTVHALMGLMTERRIRHVPVLVDAELRGIVSIGDVVKSRMGELEFEREQLSSYISS